MNDLLARNGGVKAKKRWTSEQQSALPWIEEACRNLYADAHQHDWELGEQCFAFAESPGHWLFGFENLRHPLGKRPEQVGRKWDFRLLQEVVVFALPKAGDSLAEREDFPVEFCQPESVGEGTILNLFQADVPEGFEEVVEAFCEAFLQDLSDQEVVAVYKKASHYTLCLEGEEDWIKIPLFNGITHPRLARYLTQEFFPRLADWIFVTEPRLKEIVARAERIERERVAEDWEEEEELSLEERVQEEGDRVDFLEGTGFYGWTVEIREYQGKFYVFHEAGMDEYEDLEEARRRNGFANSDEVPV